MFDIKIDSDNNRILAEIIVDSYFFDSSKYEYAFYLFRNDEKFDLSWYSSNMSVTFNIEVIPGEYQIKAYIKDLRDNSKRRFMSKKIIK